MPKTTSEVNSDKRVPIAGATMERLREFSHGLNASYDVAVNLLLDLVINTNEDPYIAGRRLRDKELSKSAD